MLKEDRQATRSPSLKGLIRAVCREYGLSPEELGSPAQSRLASEARAVVGWLAKELGSATLVAVAEAVGRDAALARQLLYQSGLRFSRLAILKACPMFPHAVFRPLFSHQLFDIPRTSLRSAPGSGAQKHQFAGIQDRYPTVFIQVTRIVWPISVGVEYRKDNAQVILIDIAVGV